MCTGIDTHTANYFGKVIATRVEEGWQADVTNAVARWLRDSLVVQGLTGIPDDLRAGFMADFLSSPGRAVDGWAITPSDVVRAWPYLKLGELVDGEHQLTLQPFHCPKCGRDIPLKLDTLELRCAEAAATGESQLDISCLSN